MVARCMVRAPFVRRHGPLPLPPLNSPRPTDFVRAAIDAPSDYSAYTDDQNSAAATGSAPLLRRNRARGQSLGPAGSRAVVRATGFQWPCWSWPAATTVATARSHWTHAKSLTIRSVRSHAERASTDKRCCERRNESAGAGVDNWTNGC